MTKRSFLVKLGCAGAAALAFTAGSPSAQAVIIIRPNYRLWRHRRYVRVRYFRR